MTALGDKSVALPVKAAPFESIGLAAASQTIADRVFAVLEQTDVLDRAEEMGGLAQGHWHLDPHDRLEHQADDGPLAEFVDRFLERDSAGELRRVLQEERKCNCIHTAFD